MLQPKARLLNRGKLLCAAVLFLTLGACGPSTPFDPVALQESSPGVVQVLYSPCAPEKLVSLEIVAPSGQVFDEKNPRIWKVLFDPPTEQRQFVLGETPPSSSVSDPWKGLEEGKTYVALVTTTSAARHYQDFRLNDLRSQRVRFHSKNLTRQQYEKAVKCA